MGGAVNEYGLIGLDAALMTKSTILGYQGWLKEAPVASATAQALCLRYRWCCCNADQHVVN